MSDLECVECGARAVNHAGEPFGQGWYCWAHLPAGVKNSMRHTITTGTAPSAATSAQDAPVASQEAEARESVVRAGWSFGGPNRGPNGRDARTAINDALNAYEAAIRASERAKVEAYEELERTVRDLLAGHGGGSWAVEAALNRIDAVRAGRAS